MSQPLKVLQGDVLAQLATLPDNSVHCCVTSPPYWGLRNYGVEGQIGLEKTPEEYIAKMVAVFREVRRVLREDGTLWLNIGDSYARNPGKGVKFERGNESIQDRQALEGNVGPEIPPGLKEKDLCMIPARVAIALQADGWWLRSKITWCKKVPMPESVTDRPTSATEEIFLMSKSADYFYDAYAVRNPPSESFLNDPRWQKGSTETNDKLGYEEAGAQNPKKLHRMFDKQRGHSRRHAGFNDRWDSMPKEDQMAFGSNMRNFWLLGPEHFAEAHFATFPTAIPKKAILAGTSAKGACKECGSPWERVTETEFVPQQDVKDPEKLAKGSRKGLDESNGWSDTPRGSNAVKHTGWQPTCKCKCADVVPCTVIDPFGGSGTSGMVALELGRHAILIELNPAYVEIINRRCHVTPGLPLA